MQIETLKLNLDDKKLELLINDSLIYSKEILDNSNILDCLESIQEPIVDTYQQIILDEKKELDEKIQKLKSFLDKDLFKSLDEFERKLLKSQFSIMSIYSNILESRINLFNKEKDTINSKEKEIYENTLKECLDLLFFDVRISDIDMEKIKNKVRYYFNGLYLYYESKDNIEETLDNSDQ